MEVALESYRRDLEHKEESITELNKALKQVTAENESLKEDNQKLTEEIEHQKQQPTKRSGKIEILYKESRLHLNLLKKRYSRVLHVLADQVAEVKALLNNSEEHRKAQAEKLELYETALEELKTQYSAIKIQHAVRISNLQRKLQEATKR